MSELRGKVALVTGSTRGIGAHIARRFAASGASVVVTGRTADLGEAVAASICATGGRAVYRQADVAERNDITCLATAALDTFGAIDVLVNNAAATDAVFAGKERSLTELQEEDLYRQLAVSLHGPVLCAKAVIPHMVAAGGGAIVNISSLAGRMGLRGSAAYSVAKGGLEALTRSIAVDYARANIRCNTIVLGIVASSEAAGLLAYIPECANAIGERVLLPRIGDNDDAAEAALYLASDRSKYVTGASLTVDGGMSINAGMPDLGEVAAKYLAQSG